MSWEDCAALVETGDPDRYLSAMTATPAGRARLFPLYAFNIEVARAPWVTSEPMLAEIRLQWWRDAIAEIFDGKVPRRHEVVQPLADVIAAANLPRPLFDALIDARGFDIYSEPHLGRAGFDAYIGATAGGLMELAVRALDAPDAAAQARQFGWASGVAALLRAMPALYAAGHDPIPVQGGLDRQAVLEGNVPDNLATVITDIVSEAQIRMAKARADRSTVPAQAIAAFHAGWQAPRILSDIANAPEHVLTRSYDVSEFRRKGGLLLRSISGRF